MKEKIYKYYRKTRELFQKYSHSAFTLTVLLVSFLLVSFSTYAGISMSVQAIGTSNSLRERAFFILTTDNDLVENTMQKSVYLKRSKYLPPKGMTEAKTGEEQDDFLTSYIGDKPLADEYYEKWKNTFSGEKMTPEDLYYFDASLIPQGENPIIPMDISRTQNGELALLNQTSFDIDPNLYAESAYTPPEASAEEGPLILILHTHGTEAFSEEGAISYSDAEATRNRDITQNIVAVGTVMKEEFERAGLSVLHCTEMFDADSYSSAYDRAAEAIRSYIAQYPTIRYVFDVHRDSLLTSEGAKIRPVILVDGVPVAQVMSVVGTDEAGSGHTGWRDNFALSVKLQIRLMQEYPNIARPINIRSASFNEQYTKGSLLLEIGSCGNTLAEAKMAGLYMARTISELILSGRN